MYPNIYSERNEPHMSKAHPPVCMPELRKESKCYMNHLPLPKMVAARNADVFQSNYSKT